MRHLMSLKSEYKSGNGKSVVTHSRYTQNGVSKTHLNLTHEEAAINILMSDSLACIFVFMFIVE